MTGITANNKVYDGTTSASLNFGNAALSGIISGDLVTLNVAGAAGVFADKTVANGKTVTVSGLALAGPNAANYTLTQPTTTANITPAGLTVTGITANNKVYNGTTSASLNLAGAQLQGVLGADQVTLNLAGATGAFANDAAGNGITVLVSGLTLAGADAGNYTLTQPTTTANITPAGLTVTGITANNKVYDGTTTASLNLGSAVLNGVLSGDVVTLNSAGATGAFTDKTVANGKTVNVSGLTLAGQNAANYTLTQPTTTANITALALTVTGITANNKAYDGTTSATLNLTNAVLVGVLSGDSVSLVTNNATGAFADDAVGNGITVLVSGLTLAGADAGNYTLTPPTTTANITGMALTVTGITANNKVYDGTTSASLNLAGAVLQGVLGGDRVTLVVTNATGAFTNAAVGVGKTVQVSGLTLVGADAGNYALTQPTTTATITPAGLTVTGVTANNKVYDGTTSASLNLGNASLSGVITGDLVTLNLAGAVGVFADKTVANGKTVTVSGLALAGRDAANYTLTQPTTTANITPAGLTVTGITGNNKVYDGTTSASLNLAGAQLQGVLGTDQVSLNVAGATGAFANAAAGTGKSVQVSGLSLTGADAGNYTLTQPTTTANITPAGLTVTGVTANNKVYDGTTTASLNLGSAALNGILSGDVVTLNSSRRDGRFYRQDRGQWQDGQRERPDTGWPERR